MKRLYPRLKERPAEFVINHDAPLAEGLRWAGLGGGRCLGSMVFYDSSPAKLHGTLVNMSAQADWLWDTAIGRWATRFDAASRKYITAATVSVVPAGVPCALAVWVKAATPGSYTGILAYYSRVSSGMIIESHTGSLRAYVNGQVFLVPGFADGTWHHGVLQRVRSTAYAFVDGGRESGSLTHGTIYDMFSPVAYDYGWFGHTSYMYTGLAADPMIWHRALNTAELAALADPYNVDLRVNGIPLILPPQRRFWPVAIVDAPPLLQIFSRRQYGPRVGVRQLQV